MPTIDASVGGTASNSYCTVATATTYFDERLKPVDHWTVASTDDQERALITASRRLDAEDWQGVKVSEGQALDWPRYWATDEDGEEYSESAIPTVIVHATCELALRLLADNSEGVDTLADTGLEEFTKAQAGPAMMERNLAFEAGQLPASVARMLSHVVRSATNSVRLTRA